MILVRSIAFNIVIFSAALVFGLVGYAVKPFRPDAVIRLGAAWAKFSLAALRLICRIETEVTGAEFLPAAGPALIAAQHQSAFDTLVWLGLVHHPAYVLKKELLRLPVLGPLLLPAGFVAVDRDGGTPAMRKMLADCRAAVAAGRPIVIFPEGTRVAPGQRGVLQPGVVALAKTLNLPVIPAATDSGRFWGRRAFFKYPGRLRIRVFAPLLGGGRREDTLAALERCFYDEGVDNSVDAAASAFTSYQRKNF